MDPDHSRIMSHMEDLIQQLRLSDSSNRSAAPGASASASNNPVQAHISPSAHSRRSFHSQPPRSNHAMPHHPSPQHPAVLSTLHSAVGPFTAPIQSPPVHHGPLPLGTPVPAMAHPSPAQSAYWPSQPGAAFPHRTHGQRTSHHWQNPPQIPPHVRPTAMTIGPETTPEVVEVLTTVPNMVPNMLMPIHPLIPSSTKACSLIT